MKSLKSAIPGDIPKILIFTQTKSTACKLFQLLRRAAVKKEYVGMYHASLTQYTKASIQHSQLVIVFGMVCACFSSFDVVLLPVLRIITGH